MARRFFRPARVLKKGMRIDQTIVDVTGRVLIASGTFLDEYLIDAVKKLGITGVYIREGEDAADEALVMKEGEAASPVTLAKIEKLSVADRAKVHLDESVRARVAEGISYLFSNTESSDFTSATETIADDLMKAINENDALVTERPYKQGFSPRDAVEMIMAMTAELDIDAMKSFLRSVILYPVGSTVMLSNGEVARVVENYEKFILRPKVVGLKSGRVYDLGNDISCANIIIR